MTNTVSKTVSDETLNCIIQIESGGNPRAKAATSSATGLGQFLNSTWLGLIDQHRPDIAESMDQTAQLALRLDPFLSIEMLARFTEGNLATVGRKATGGDLYLAHFLGAGDAARVFRAPPDQLVDELVAPRVIAANRSIMAGKTCAQVRAWSARRMHESAGYDWVARYYKPVDEEPAAEPEETPDSFPDPQRPAPAPPAPAPAPAPSPVTPKENEDFFTWVKRKGKTIAGWMSGGTLGTIGLSSFTDWRIVAVIVGGVVVSGTLAGLFYIASRRSST